MNPKTGGCLFIVSSDHWKVFCCTMATNLPLYPSFIRLHWRRNMKQWSVFWRKYFMISMSGLFTLIWRCWSYCWNSNQGSPIIHAFCACEIVGTLLSTTWKITGLLERNWCLAEQKSVINKPLVDRDRILFPLLHIKLSMIKQFTKALDKDSGCSTYLCQSFPEIDDGEFESCHHWWSSNLSAHQISWVWKLSVQTGTGSIECFCSGREELSGQ